MVRYLTRSQFADDYTTRPDVGDGDVTRLIPDAARQILDIAETWLGWDGTPIRREGNVWTPHKALRRVADHLLDHLAEIEGPAGRATDAAGRLARPDEGTWTLREVVHHVSGVTAYADMIGRLS